MRTLLVFTDLDGTLISLREGLYEPALETIKKLLKFQIPIIIATSKSPKEVELWQKRLGIYGPFIAENGGGIFIPKDYPLFVPKEAEEYEKRYWLVPLGKPYAYIRHTVKELRERGFKIEGFGDMTPLRVAQLTGLSEEEAILAKERLFSEPCLFEGDERSLRENLREKGLIFWQGGRFFHLQSDHDKGKAMEILLDLFRRNGLNSEIVALGDSRIDLPMLERAKWKIIVKRPGGISENPPKWDNLFITDQEGPWGWTEAISKLLKELHYG
jgi:mannosyl-3-phosphoglycerate phosphatase